MILALVLVGFGLLMIYSASSILAMRTYGDSYYFIKRQLVWAGLGFGGMWLLARTPYGRFRGWVLPGLIACVMLLLAVLLLPLGKSVGGARRWLALGPLSFQPAEMLKLVLVVYLADALVRKQALMREFSKGVVPHLVVAGGLAGLLLLQPDLGTAVIIVAVTVAMLFIGGARLAHLFGLGLAALPVVFLLIFKVAYRRRRWDAFLDPWQDALGKGFQIVQSFLALGSGGLWGRGLCESQQKLFYLPTPHTDFIYSIVGEELGFAGAFAVLLVFGGLIWKGFSIARNCPDRFGKMLAVGLTMLLGLQAFINIGVTTGLVPTKGTTLPFVSAGGSSLLFSLLAIGILLSISSHAVREEE
ncbi:MAG: putative lipid II flippase FtsW [Candidatus Firestonebacteria bacterium]|nr:putative lipid II flippase FtsW [Candidatus Firestonebacteria bacterium]